jgi:hypothetical protein
LTLVEVKQNQQVAAIRQEAVWPAGALESAACREVNNRLQLPVSRRSRCFLVFCFTNRSAVGGNDLGSGSRLKSKKMLHGSGKTVPRKILTSFIIGRLQS